MHAFTKYVTLNQLLNSVPEWASKWHEKWNKIKTNKRNFKEYDQKTILLELFWQKEDKIMLYDSFWRTRLQVEMTFSPLFWEELLWNESQSYVHWEAEE